MKRPSAPAPRLAVFPLGRTTFDVGFAEEKLRAMLAALDALGCDLVGPRTLITDMAAGKAAMEALETAGFDQILVLQVTFTDAEFVCDLAGRFDAPLALWAVPEPRLGGRLRLNAFCGLNLASHALSITHRPFSWLYADPEAEGVEEDLADLLAGKRVAEPLPPVAAEGDKAAGMRSVEALRGRRIGRIGEHPAGFATCRYDRDAMKTLSGVDVEEIALEAMFDAARAVPADAAAPVRALADGMLEGLDGVDQDQLDRSLKLKIVLEEMKAGGRYDAFAIRCWPETFTDYGGAACGPVAMMGEARTPCACEADVYGALTQLLLQSVADAPVFLTDLVDMDVADDTGIVWHCGQAPASMADPAHRMEAAIHTNRRMPLLFQFPLKPGRVTFARISQAHGGHRLVVGAGEMLARPMAFTGTSGVVRFDGGTAEALKRLIGAGVEHHMALAYGDHRQALLDFAAAADLPVTRL